MKVDVRIESEDLKGALRTYIQRRLHFRDGSPESAGVSGFGSRTSPEPETFSTRHATPRRNIFPQGESYGRKRSTEISISPSISLRNRQLFAQKGFALSAQEMQ